MDSNKIWEAGQLFSPKGIPTHMTSCKFTKNALDRTLPPPPCQFFVVFLRTILPNFHRELSLNHKNSSLWNACMQKYQTTKILDLFSFVNNFKEIEVRALDGVFLLRYEMCFFFATNFNNFFCKLTYFFLITSAITNIFFSFFFLFVNHEIIFFFVFILIY